MIKHHDRIRNGFQNLEPPETHRFALGIRPSNPYDAPYSLRLSDPDPDRLDASPIYRIPGIRHPQGTDPQRYKQSGHQNGFASRSMKYIGIHPDPRILITMITLIRISVLNPIRI